MTYAAPIGLLLLVLLLALQLPVALSLILASALGIVVANGPAAALDALAAAPVQFAGGAALLALPLVILSGALAVQGPMAAALRRLLDRLLPPGPAVLLCGAALSLVAWPATAAAVRVIGNEAAPRPGPDEAARAAAGSGAGVLMPPSVLLLLYAAITGASLRVLMLGGLMAGAVLLLAVLAVSVRGEARPWRPAPLQGAAVQPALLPLPVVAIAMGGFLLGLWGIAVAAAAMVVAMAAAVLLPPALSAQGPAPTEAPGAEPGTEAAEGAILPAGEIPPEAAPDGGVLSTTPAAPGGNRLRHLRRLLASALSDTGSAVGSLVLLGIGSDMFARFLTATGLTASLSGIDMGLLPVLLLLAVVALIVGTLLEPLAALAMLLPVLMPVVATTGLDPAWFGVALVKLLETAMILPPLGMTPFVLRAVLSRRLPAGAMRAAMAPYLWVDLAVALLLMSVPLWRG